MQENRTYVLVRGEVKPSLPLYGFRPGRGCRDALR